MFCPKSSPSLLTYIGASHVRNLFVFNKLRRGQGEKIRWSSCPPPFLPANFKAGRSQGFHNHVRHRFLSLSLLLGRRRCSEEKRRGIFLSEILDANSLVRSESFCGKESEFFSSFFSWFFRVFFLRIWVVKADELKKREQAIWPWLELPAFLSRSCVTHYELLPCPWGGWYVHPLTSLIDRLITMCFLFFLFLIAWIAGNL